MNALQFGLDVPASAAPGSDPVREAAEAERLGFDFVSTSDHPCGTSPSFETWTMLAWIAAATTRIRLATRVLGVPYRPPAMVAKMAETFDRLSGGRLILGMGGGYSDEEFRAFGLPVPTPRDKIDGLEEAVAITRGLWSRPAFTFAGRLYHTEAADLEPKPDRRIPIWLGTFGPRALALTGRVADGWIPSYGLVPPDVIAGPRDRVLAAAEEAGRDPGAVALAYNIEVRIGAGTGDLTGTPEQVAEGLTACVKLGFTALNLKPTGPDRTEQVHRLAEEVLPAVRASA
ncbi:LLM class flavin-dependent oxidoreductase [Actinomadura soli]|nr:LLM class flavin-dependent oxidoreductase [Actinomadura soli]